jgi:predicted esterase
MEPHGSRPVVLDGTPLEEAKAAMILVHGRGAAPESILELAHALEPDGFALLAPAAAGNTWYPHSFLAPTEMNEPGLSSALKVLAGLVERCAAEGIPRERIVLMGFSQGACLASEFARRNPGRYGGILVFSGGVIGPPGTDWDTSGGNFEGTPVFLGCSDVDHHVPLERIHDTTRVFEAMGASVDTRIYPGMGHLVNADEVRAGRALLEEVRSAAGP